MPKDKVIVDTSCLIALENLGIVYILCDLYQEVIITQGVLDEFGKIKLKCVKVRKVKEPILKLFEQRLNLGKGEAEVITFAFRNKYTAIIDDLTARNVAKELGIKVTGTIGILLKAERAGLVKSAYEKATELKKKGFYLPDALLAKIKRFK